MTCLVCQRPAKVLAPDGLCRKRRLDRATLPAYFCTLACAAFWGLKRAHREATCAQAMASRRRSRP